MNIRNETPYIVQNFPARDAKGNPMAVTVVKATYAFSADGQIKIATNQTSLWSADEYWGDVGHSSLRYASDMVPEKTGTDISLNGHVYAPMNRPVPRLQAGLKVGKISKVVTVMGDRTWQYNMGMATPTKPRPFVRMPLSYERAFGGEDPFFDQERNRQLSTFNPVGTGFRITRSREALDGLKLPNIEHPKRLMKSWNDKPKPAGFGCIAPSWEPRSSLCGTFDRIWERERYPLLPLDFNPEFYNAAAPDLIARPFLNGKERVYLTHVHPERDKVSLALPGIRLRCAYSFGQQSYTRKPNLDTLIIEPDLGRIIMVYRFHYHGRNLLTRLKQVSVYYDD